MAIVRSCSYSSVIFIPEPAENYTKIEVSFAQDQQIVVTKSDGDLETASNAVVVSLTSEETLLFRPSVKSPMGRRLGGSAFVQIRLFKDSSDAPGSKCWPVEVHDSLQEGAINNE